MAGVQVEGLSKTYDRGRTLVLDSASFEAHDGELLVLVGPSGCGKSTLLRIIAGLEEPTTGTIRIGTRVVNEVAPKDRDIAMVFQSYALYPHMTVAENLRFSLKLHRRPREEVERRMREAAELLGITAMLDRYPRQLSGGQRQRVALGRALVRNPQVFLMDEPLSNLDARLRLSMRAEIARLHRRLQTTMIYVTHDQIEAMTLGQRIVVMNRGRIQQVGAPMKVYERPANVFVAGFIGSPAMNLLTGRLLQSPGWRLSLPGAELPLGPLESPTIAALKSHLDEQLTIGLRPEDLRLVHGAQPPSAPVVSARLELIEPVGNEVFVTARLGEADLTLRIAPQPLPGPGMPLELSFAPGRLHFFDPCSGERIETR